MVEDSSIRHDRRAFVSAIASGSVASLAGCSSFDPEEDEQAAEVDDDRALSLAEQFAPTVYFDRHERWFPTDPRQYASDSDDRTVVGGFDALEGYVRAGGSEDPPEPKTFYHVVEYERSPLAVVQYWFYSVFDQFTTNFHWHDWEVLQVFVDTETGEPQLYVASSHARSVPNNEHLDPDPERQPHVLSELGSHSSGLSINDNEDSFQRLPLNDRIADITNSVVDSIDDIVTIPLAYGLPRDEGLALPFVVPELEGEPVYEHERLPSVDSSNLLPESLTIDSFEDVRSPPTDLPNRETGYRFDYRDHDEADTDVTYDLVSTGELEHIAEFTGPQMSFEFAIPDFAEDVIGSHLKTTGVPWKSPRYDNPATDISEASHRQALADRYDAIGEPSPVTRVVAGVTNAVSSDDAPEDEGLTTVSSPLEMFALLQSEPVGVPTFQGVAVFQDVPEGEHRLTVNGAGVAPHSETVAVGGDGETTKAGVDGEIPVVAREHATKIEVDPRESDSQLSDLAVEDDFAGRLYDAPLSGPDAVYVHRGGAFTTEVQDKDGEVGAFRVNPDEEQQVRIDNPQTGKTPLATYLADLAEETRDEVAAVASDNDGDRANNSGGQGNAVQGLANALDAVAEAARRAAENAANDDKGNADRKLETVANRLETVESRLADARGSIPNELSNAADNRLEQARRRREQAQNANKL